MRPRARASPWPMLLGIGAVLLVSAAWLAYLYRVVAPAGKDQLDVELGKTLLNLLFVGLAAMLIKAVVDQFVAARERERQETMQQEADARRAAEAADLQRREDHARRVQALATLTKSYWNTKKALKIIEAHRSAKSYGDQIRVVIDHRLELQQLENDISAGMYALANTDTIVGALDQIDKQLGLVTDEWRDKYLALAQQQNVDEKEPTPERRRVPHEIEHLPKFGAVRANGFAALHEPFEIAANVIRRQVFVDRAQTR